MKAAWGSELAILRPAHLPGSHLRQAVALCEVWACTPGYWKLQCNTPGHTVIRDSTREQ